MQLVAKIDTRPADAACKVKTAGNQEDEGFVSDLPTSQLATASTSCLHCKVRADYNFFFVFWGSVVFSRGSKKVLFWRTVQEQ